MDSIAIDFLNSDWHDARGSGAGVDHLQDPQWLGRFLERWELGSAGRASAQILGRLTVLRAVLRRIVDAEVAGSRPTGADVDELNRYLAAAPAIRRLVHDKEAYRLDTVAQARGWDWVMAEIARSLAELLARPGEQRIKVCANPDCRWVFYDESKSRTRRWCDDSCGNLLKVRRFRARERASARRPRRARPG